MGFPTSERSTATVPSAPGLMRAEARKTQAQRRSSHEQHVLDAAPSAALEEASTTSAVAAAEGTATTTEVADLGHPGLKLNGSAAPSGTANNSSDNSSDKALPAAGVPFGNETRRLGDGESANNSLPDAGVPFGKASVNSTAPADSPITEEKLYEIRPNPGVHPLAFVIILVGVIATCMIGDAVYTRASAAAASGAEGQRYVYVHGTSDSATSDGAPGVAENDDGEKLHCVDMSEDIYGLVAMSVVLDLRSFAKEGGPRHGSMRGARLLTSVCLAFANVALQTFMIYCIMEFSAAKAVADIRSAYDEFENHMYNGHIYKTINGYARGEDMSYFDPTRFETLSADAKTSACRIPFSQPWFLAAVLLTWTIIVFGELRDTVKLMERLLIKTETADSMLDSVKTEDEDGTPCFVVHKLTRPVKAVFAIFLFLPRLVITGLLLWLGCRWLAATNDFQGLLLNGVGLEFVLLLKDLLYRTLVPDRSKRDVQRLKIDISHESTQPSPCAFFGAFAWGLVAMSWVYLYINHFQSVLPHYQNDVHDICQQWYEANYASLI